MKCIDSHNDTDGIASLLRTVFGRLQLLVVMIAECSPVWSYVIEVIVLSLRKILFYLHPLNMHTISSISRKLCQSM